MGSKRPSLSGSGPRIRLGEGKAIMTLFARPILIGALIGSLAMGCAVASAADRKPLFYNGPKTATAKDPIEFAAGDDLSKLGPGLIWQNEQNDVKGLKQVVIASFQV